MRTQSRSLEDEISAVLRPTWADHIEVKRHGDQLLIVGEGRGKDLQTLVKEYVSAPNGPKGPHLDFANAKTDDELIKFIREWGPITAAHYGVGGTGGRCRKATENLESVRNVRAVVASAMEVFTISRAHKPDLQSTLAAMNKLIAAMQYVREDAMLPATVDCEVIRNRVQATKQRRNFEYSDLQQSCNDVLCALVNRYPERLVATKDGVLTVPAAEHGVFPLLMFMLRQDLLRERRIIVCERCGLYFLQQRHSETSCSPSCKDVLRQRRYYGRRKKKILRRRRKKRRQARKAT